MTLNHALLAAVAVGALVAPQAQAAAKKHHAKPAAAAAPHDSALKSEVDELKAEVAALREELKAQREAGATTQTQVAQVQTQAETATQTAAAASTKADAAVAKADAVKTAEAKTEKSVGAMSWAGDTKIGATMFFNASNINQQSTAVAGAAPVKQSSNGTGFNVKRIYLSVDHKFNDVWSANITTDISNVIGQSANANYYNGTTATNDIGKGLFIKKAFVQAKISPMLVIRAGAADTAWIAYMESQYEHRYVDLTLTDNYKLANSADWGITALGDFANGLISYQVAVVNGAGYRTVNVTNSVDFDGRISAKYKGFWAAVGGYTGHVGKNVEGTTITHTANRFDAGLGYKTKLFNVGGEYVFAKDLNSQTSTTEDENEGWSVFGNVNFAPKWQVFGRYDWIKQTPNTTTGFSVHNSYWNVGLQWEPAKIVDISLVYKRDSATNFGTANGTIAQANGTGSIGGIVGGNYDEVGLFGLIKF